MSKDPKIREKYKIAAQAVGKAGGTPIPVNDTLLDILEYFIMEDELDFVAAFLNQTSQTMEQLKESSQLGEAEIEAKVKKLAARGVIFDQPNRKGVMVYRLLPLINVGTFEYTFMGPLEDNPRNREISALFKKLFEEFTELIEANYDSLMPMMMNAPPVDRTVPVTENRPTGKKIKVVVNQSVQTPVERIIPTQEVQAIIDKFDDIAVGHCFCRHYRDMLDRSCEQTDERENCFSFGKSARYTSSQGFSRLISKQEALAILKRAEEAGLVHKAYHPNFNTLKDETSICNCCRCCCGNSVVNSHTGVVNAAHYLVEIDTTLCTGCGTCVEMCHTFAATIGDDGKAQRDKDRCIGCGVCAAFCPENAVSLIEQERIVRIPAKRKD